MLALFVGLFSSTAFGATLADYRARVHSATLAVDSLIAFGAKAELGEAANVVGEVRRLLPKTEKVEWGGGPQVVNNEWLHRALDEYPRAEADERPAILKGVAERLRAVEARLTEAEAGAAAPRDKDAEKGRLANILRHPDYSRKAAEQSALQRLLQRFLEWLRELIPDVRPVQPGTNPRVSQAAQFIIVALCLGLIGFLGWKFWRRRPRDVKAKKARAARVVLGERVEAEQDAADLLEDAERLARAGDLRGAIRKAYIALLCELGDRRVIRLAQHKTNRDYLQSIRDGEPRLYQEVLPLTFNFELHWYGLQDASEHDWADFRARCKRALGTL